MVTVGAVGAIGNFDGVHRGHLHLLEEASALATALKAPIGVVLFEPHPRRFFQPDSDPFLITTPKKRDALLRAAGVDEIFSLTFDSVMTARTPENFVAEVLLEQLGLKGIVVGEDFRFGKDRAGDARQLKSLAEENHMECAIAGLLARDRRAEKFGSTAVRQAIVAGQMKEAATMLGRNWSVAGTIVKGEQRGRTIGFPTANMTLGEIIEPRFGVYATKVHFGNEVFAAVSNYGRRPTVGAPRPLLETHLFDFTGDLYGTVVEVEFVDFLRDERKFAGLDELKAQIAHDSEAARNIFANL